MSRKLAVALFAVVAVVSLWRIGASIFEYELSVIDRNAPKIPGELMRPPVFIPDPPPPPKGKLPKTLPPNENPESHPYNPDDARRQVITT
jgi:hypothetical protein